MLCNLGLRLIDMGILFQRVCNVFTFSLFESLQNEKQTLMTLFCFRNIAVSWNLAMLSYAQIVTYLGLLLKPDVKISSGSLFYLPSGHLLSS